MKKIEDEDSISDIAKLAAMHRVWADDVSISHETPLHHKHHESHDQEAMEINSTLSRVVAAISKGLFFH